MKTCWTLLAVTAASLSIAGCAAQARSPEPVPVDRVECARCRMLISSEAGSGEILSAADETRFYDDIGCMAADWGTPHDGAAAYVQLASGGWKDAPSAFFGQPASARTPMGWGFVAYAAAADARAADRLGRALTWEDVVRAAGERP